MGIQELSIKGFRSLRDVTWRPGRLNVVIGPNGSGKSNLLSAIGLLRAAATGGLSEAILHMGGIAPLLWDGQVQELAWAVRLDPLGEVLDPQSRPLCYELGLRQLGMSSSYRVEYERLSRDVMSPIGLSIPETLLERVPGRTLSYEPKGTPSEPFDRLPEDHAALAMAVGVYYHLPRLSGVNDVLSSWNLYHDINVGHDSPLRQAAVARMERRVAADGRNLIPVLHTLYTGSREFKRVVDDAMRAVFSTDYEELVFPPAADQRVQLRVRWRSLRSEQSAADLSDGTLRFLLLLAILASPDPPQLIAFDEPETGLHPSMLSIVAEHAADAAGRTQVILTTHSAQLLDAFTASPVTTSVTKWEEGETRLSVVDGDELARWLREYGLGALFRSGELEGMT